MIDKLLRMQTTSKQMHNWFPSNWTSFASTDERVRNFIVRALWSRKFINLKGHLIPFPTHSSRMFLRNSSFSMNPSFDNQTKLSWWDVQSWQTTTIGNCKETIRGRQFMRALSSKVFASSPIAVGNLKAALQRRFPGLQSQRWSFRINQQHPRAVIEQI